jgi:hypothetical protein
VAVDVTSVFVAYFARNLGPVPGDPDARQPPDYGVSASLDGEVIDLTLTFRAGSAYCCFEWGCHLALAAGKRWERLRVDLGSCDVSAIARLVLRVTVVVEAGAMFFDWSRPEPSCRGRGWYAFAPVAAGHSYKVIVPEGGQGTTEAGAAVCVCE